MVTGPKSPPRIANRGAGQAEGLGLLSAGLCAVLGGWASAGRELQSLGPGQRGQEPKEARQGRTEGGGSAEC